MVNTEINDEIMTEIKHSLKKMKCIEVFIIISANLTDQFFANFKDIIEQCPFLNKIVINGNPLMQGIQHFKLF